MNKPTRERVEWARQQALLYISGKKPWSAATEDEVLGILLSATDKNCEDMTKNETNERQTNDS